MYAICNIFFTISHLVDKLCNSNKINTVEIPVFSLKIILRALEFVQGIDSLIIIVDRKSSVVYVAIPPDSMKTVFPELDSNYKKKEHISDVLLMILHMNAYSYQLIDDTSNETINCINRNTNYIQCGAPTLNKPSPEDKLIAYLKLIVQTYLIIVIVITLITANDTAIF